MTEFHQITEFRHILVGWDNSPGAVAALKAAAALADDDRVQVTVLAVVGPAGHSEEADEAAAEYAGWRDRIREAFDRAQETLADTVRPRVTLRFTESGDAARAVCEYAHDHAFDLLVLGRHGTGGLLHPRLGHVAATAARKSELPLLLAP